MVHFPAGVFMVLFLFANASIPVLESPYLLGSRDSSPGLKRPGREADHSPPSSNELKIAWSYTSTPPEHLHGVVLN
jgi:hypothetical protein